MILLDSSVLIEMFRKKEKQETFFYYLTQTEENFAISVITHYEILCGSNENQNNFWNNFIKLITIIPFDTNISSEAIKIYKDLKRSNRMIDLADIFIAATAKSNKIMLATLNIDHFSRIKGLKLIKK
jgi:tRNA(fMet)-specific endonuclease VapC